ncbi:MULTISPECIES: histidine phosphatase family protein [Anoxynatronum]|uniref:phosphoglycerate mutase (2,3-diphosphoglycerate-dependent) n=2 Tax=Anoxynatronum TaxID=210622 RepID=A0AA45WT57_9CLOT|nr:histidine phosphatase family protein [Anoxynatronum buryatiense]SMP39984.1 probable phosphoglycerate mutase [Anoxynatronum buryatiense]
MKERMVFLIRHAEPATDHQESTYLGWENPSLSSQGEQQAKAAALALKYRSLQAIYASDLIRAVETAAVIASFHHKPVVQMASLREINLGNWGGKRLSEIKKTDPEAYTRRGREIDTFRPPKGESFADLAKRVLPAFYGILEDTCENIAIVAHAGVNRVILSHLLGMELKSLFEIQQCYTQISLIKQLGAVMQVEALNLLPANEAGKEGCQLERSL